MGPWGVAMSLCLGLSDSQDVGFGDYFWVGLFLAQKTIYNIERGITSRLSRLVLIVNDMLICYMEPQACKSNAHAPDERVNLLLFNGKRKLAM